MGAPVTLPPGKQAASKSIALTPRRSRPYRARSFADLLAGTTPAAGTNLGADAAGDQLVDVARLAREVGVRAAVVDGTTVHDRGASDVQELGYAMAVLAHALRTLAGAGFTVAEIRQMRIHATHQVTSVWLK